MKNLGLQLLGIWLIAQSAIGFFKLHFTYDKVILAALALSAGIVLLADAISSRLGNIGLFMVAVWLLVNSCMFIFKLTFPASEMIMAIIAAVAGMLLILKK